MTIRSSFRHQSQVRREEVGVKDARGSRGQRGSVELSQATQREHSLLG